MSQDSSKEEELYKANLEQTKTLHVLFQIPLEQRDLKWQKRFFAALPTAAFRCGDPQVIKGPDGFPYFQLILPEPGEPFQGFVLQHMKDDFLLERGVGVVINPTQNKADWVFSYGDILHYHQKNTFEYPEIPPTPSGQETLTESEKVLISMPSESFFPPQTRTIVREFLQANGLSVPKVLLMMRKDEPHLAFNLTPDSVGSQQKCQAIFQSLIWFFPRDYRLIGVDEKQFSASLKPF